MVSHSAAAVLSGMGVSACPELAMEAVVTIGLGIAKSVSCRTAHPFDPP